MSMIPLEELYEDYLNRDWWLIAADQYHDAALFGVEQALRWFVRHDKAPFRCELPYWHRVGFVWYDPLAATSSFQPQNEWLKANAPKTCIVSPYLTQCGSGKFAWYGDGARAVAALIERYIVLWETLQ